ncbi:discoidin domain-containing protein [Micromonospora sagamiensis]|uniref:F5/8 type C domain-containing protein n=1 Tax=Micromonospora sagamiensis TaxID=47875 RepID=A0A562WF98_9ACTN|nr:discoidin domain-containing protein [Micromonospora sagamiensis]TWJ28950.1 F5/8 type C domain-containing protein [Micromonospora sagamiensis]BCL18025.1 glycosyl hydrolase [Micromonospora sagamiensis]
MSRLRTRLVAALAALGLAVTAAPVLSATPAAAAGGPNLAAGRPVAVSSTNGSFVAGNLTDGNQGTYWESSGALPQWAQVDLGASVDVDQVRLKLPAGWEDRTQTLSVQGSPDGGGFSTIVASAGRAFGPANANTVTINFPATTTRYVRVAITANTGWPAAQLAELEVYGVSTSSTNLALGRAMTASGHSDVYGATNANDGNQATYWESPNNAWPQWLRVDLGSAVGVNRVVLKVPGGWETRTQTLTVQGSTDGSVFATIVASAGYAFNPAGGNTVTITFGATTTRYVRLLFTGNTAWPAGQISELEVYGPTTGDTVAPSAPGNLAYTQPAPGQIRLTWNASTDNVGVTGYDVYANGVLRTSVSGTTLTYTDTQPTSATVSYHVRAKDAAGNQSANSNTVTRTGDTGDTVAPSAPTNLAYTRPAPGQIRLTWSASTDNVGVTGYDVYANGALRASVGGSTLTYTDSQPDSATVSYHVRAKDAAGNVSATSNTVTRPGDTSGGGSNLAAGKPATASSVVHTFQAANAVDNDVTTYWEGAPGAYPSTLTVALGANASISSVVVKLNPDPAWGPRTQTFQVLGREQSESGFTTLVGSATYSFSPTGSNTVTIPVSATAADVRLQFTANSGSSNGQVAEFQVIGNPAPNPDLTITGLTAAPSAPVETDTITLSATVRNAGTAASGATAVGLYLGTTKVGTATVGALAAGASTTVSAAIGARNAGTYQLIAKVDEANTVIEQNEANNSFTSPTALTVRPVDSSDLVASAVTWSPGTPSAGSTVSFAVTIRNQGTIASASGAHGVTLTVLNDAGTVVRTLTGSYSGTIAAGATAGPLNLGTWTAVNGRYTVRVVLADDANELPVKRQNNTSDRSLYVGRGANLPYDMYEAEEGSVGGGAQVIGPNRTIGDLAGEASGRRAVTLNTTGAYVEWTTKAPTNTLVTRFSIPDAAGGGGINSTLNIYVNGTLHKPINLTSKHIWLYGAEAGPGNSPSAGGPRHIYDEANVMLNSTIPAGSRIRLQKDPANSTTYAIDFVNLELVAPRANPDPARYRVPNGFGHADVQAALDAVRMDTTGTLVGVYLPAGTYETAQKFQVYGKAVQVVGAGMWYTRFQTPQSQENTDAGFRVESSASGSTFAHLAFFGNYTNRIDGPGKVWGELKDVDNLTLDSVWVEHTVCAYWGVSVSGLQIRNSRFRNTFADAVNMTNGSTNNLVTNSEGRSNGDDAFALFSAIDQGGGTANHGNVFENLTATLTWRAAGVAVYGGYDNVFRNLYIADMLTYSGITISSLDFGYPFIGFGASPPTRFENISLIRAGGHFWGSQTFPAIWVFSASKEFRGIRVTDVDIVDPTYSGIMFQTKYNGGQPENPVTDTIFTNVSISGARRSGDAFDAKSGFGIWVNEMPEPNQGPAVGSATFVNLRLSDNHQDIRNTTSTFTINRS